MPGPWNTASPPLRPGIGANFVAAATAAVEGGVDGTALVVGEQNYGPSDKPYEMLTEAAFDGLFGTQASATLRNGVLDAFDGFDQGSASRVLALRVVSVATPPVKATCILEDVPNVDALTITAKYGGTRANNWYITTQAAPSGAGKELILYESGVELERIVTGGTGTNTQAAAAINLSSKYMTAVVTGAADRVLENGVGVLAGNQAFGTGSGGTAGTDGAAVTTGDIAAALVKALNYDFKAAVVAEQSSQAAHDVIVAWSKDYNSSGRRAFTVIGGPAAETQANALVRSTRYDDATTYATYGVAARDVVVLTTDLIRLSDSVVIPSAKAAARVAGLIAGIGIRRSPVYATLKGYQVSNPYTPSAYETAQAQGIMPFASDGIDQVRIEAGNTAMITFTTVEDGLRPSVHGKVSNVAIDHEVERTLNSSQLRDYIASLRQSVSGRQQIVSSILEYLRTLEKLGVLENGSSVVDLDSTFVQAGTAVYISVAYTYAQTLERIFLSVRVR